MPTQRYLTDCCTEVGAGGYVVVSMSDDDGRCWAYSVGLHHNSGHPELFAEAAAADGSGADVQADLEGLVDLLCGAVVVGTGIGGSGCPSVQVDPQDRRFEFGRLVLDSLDLRWPPVLRVSRESLAMLSRVHVGDVERAGVLECRVPFGRTVDRIPGAAARGRQLPGLQLPAATRNAGDTLTGLDSARNHLWPSTSVTALSIPTTALR